VDVLFDINAALEYFPKILARLHITFFIVLISILIGTFFGAILALCRYFKIPILNQFSIIYISFIRGTPVVIQLFLFFYGLPLLLQQIGININRWDKMIFVVITYGFNSASFLAEIFRSSISSVSIGQTEAAYSIGLSRLQTIYRIVIPQAVVVAIPTMGTLLIMLLQETSIAFTLGVIDVIGEVRIIGARTRRYMEGYVDAAFIFLILSIVLERGFQKIENILIKKKGK
jgi:L-cystine transport system permease protein